MTEATAETLQRVEWTRRHIEWLLPRISGSDDDKMHFLDMWFAAMNERHVEGTIDAMHVVERVHSEFPCNQTKVLVKALSDLANLNRKT